MMCTRHKLLEQTDYLHLKSALNSQHCLNLISIDGDFMLIEMDPYQALQHSNHTLTAVKSIQTGVTSAEIGYLFCNLLCWINWFSRPARIDIFLSHWRDHMLMAPSLSEHEHWHCQYTIHFYHESQWSSHRPRGEECSLLVPVVSIIPLCCVRHEGLHCSWSHEHSHSKVTSYMW